MAHTDKTFCSPCQQKHVNKPATIWCTECDEGLCDVCEQVHRTLKVSTNHMVINIYDYRKMAHLSVEQTCQRHDKPLEIYCKKHDSVLCSSCIPSDQINCSDNIPLQDAAKNAKTSSALDDLEETLSSFLKELPTLVDKQKKSHEDLDIQLKSVKMKIENTRDKIVRYLENLEKELVDELTKYIEERKSLTENIIVGLVEAQQTMNRIQKETIYFKQFASDVQLFLKIRQSNKSVQETINSITQPDKSLKKYNIVYETQPELDAIFSTVKRFGTFRTDEIVVESVLYPKGKQAQIIQNIVKGVSDFKLIFTKSFPVKQDGGRMTITGCAILQNGLIVIADYSGNSQLLLFNERGSHVSDIPLSNDPYDVTVINSGQIAVSYGLLWYIEILDIRTKTRVKSTELNGGCRGLSFHSGMIYVLVYGQGIAVVDSSGSVIKTLRMDVEDVYYITTSPDRIYFSNFIRHSITCCDMNGDHLWEFKCDEMKKPFGLTIDSNENVFVTGRQPDVVIVISRDGKSYKKLLTSAEGLGDARAIYFSKQHRTLLVCNNSDSRASIFRI